MQAKQLVTDFYSFKKKLDDVVPKTLVLRSSHSMNNNMNNIPTTHFQVLKLVPNYYSDNAFGFIIPALGVTANNDFYIQPRHFKTHSIWLFGDQLHIKSKSEGRFGTRELKIFKYDENDNDSDINIVNEELANMRLQETPLPEPPKRTRVDGGRAKAAKPKPKRRVATASSPKPKSPRAPRKPRAAKKAN